MWFGINIGYRGIAILRELPLCTSLVRFGWGFVVTLVKGIPLFFMNCLYVLLWFDLDVVLYSHGLQEYHDSSQVVST